MNCLLLADENSYGMKISDDDDRNSYFPKIMAYFSVDATKKEALDKWIYVENHSSFPSVLFLDLSSINELVTYFV